MGTAALADDAEKTKPPRRRLLVRKLALAFAAFGLTVLLLELGARLYLPRFAPVRLRDGVYASTLPLATGVASPSFRHLPTGEPLPAAKPAGQLRIAVFGESSVQGVPYGLRASAPTMLYDLLHEAYPERDIVVINMGRSGSIYVNTYYHLLFVERYEPDAIIFYMGMNDDPYRGGEACWPVRHPLLHGIWRGAVERLQLLWAVRALLPAALWAGDEGASGAGEFDCPGDSSELWTDILVRTAADMSATVIVTTPVRSAASVLEPNEDSWSGPDLARLSPSYRALLTCRLTPGCDFYAALERALQQPDDQAEPSLAAFFVLPGTRPRTIGETHERTLDQISTAWRSAAERHGADFVDFRAALASVHERGILADAQFTDEIHLSLDGYAFLARHWLERLRPVVGGDPAGTPRLPQREELRRYREGGSEDLATYVNYLRRGWVLTVVPGIESAARQADAAGARWGRLTMAWLRQGVGLAPGLSPEDARDFADFDPLQMTP